MKGIMGTLSRREHATGKSLVSSTFCFSLNQGTVSSGFSTQVLFAIISILCIKMAGSIMTV